MGKGVGDSVLAEGSADVAPRPQLVGGRCLKTNRGDPAISWNLAYSMWAGFPESVPILVEIREQLPASLCYPHLLPLHDFPLQGSSQLWECTVASQPA